MFALQVHISYEPNYRINWDEYRTGNLPAVSFFSSAVIWKRDACNSRNPKNEKEKQKQGNGKSAEEAEVIIKAL